MEPVDGNFNEINIKRRVRVANLNWEDPCSWIDISHNVWQGSQHEEFPWNLKWSQKSQQSKHQLNCGLHLRIQPGWEANATTINIDDCETEVVGIPFNKPIFNGAVISVVEISEKIFRQEAGSQGQAIWRDSLIGKASFITTFPGAPDVGHNGWFENQRYLFWAKCICQCKEKIRRGETKD